MIAIEIEQTYNTIVPYFDIDYIAFYLLHLKYHHQYSVQKCQYYGPGQQPIL